MRVKPRLLIIAAMTAAFFGTAPAFASDDPQDTAPVGEVELDDAPIHEDDAPPFHEDDTPPFHEDGLPESWDPDTAGPGEPIEDEPNYTG
jgi:hypothetical protein